MKCMSFNCRGFASASKKLALKRLIELEPIDIIMLQETLGKADHISHSLQAMFLNWTFSASDAAGRLGVWLLDIFLALSELRHPGGDQDSWDLIYSLLILAWFFRL